MKNILKVGLLLLVFSVVMSSCTDEDKFNNPVFFELERGGLVRFTNVFTDYLLAGDTPESATFSEEIFDPNGNLKALEISLVTATDTILVETVTSFPFQFSMSGADLATLTGAAVSFGQSFEFYNVAVRNDDTRFTPDPLESDFEANEFSGNTQGNLISQDGYADALNFTLIIACPTVDFDAILGTYDVVVDAFGTFVDGATTFEIVAGPGENQILVPNIFNHTNPVTGLKDYDVVMEVDPVNGAVTVASQEAWHCDNFGCGFGVGSIVGGGRVFSCVGLLQLTLNHNVAAGGFGAFALVMQKQ